MNKIIDTWKALEKNGVFFYAFFLFIGFLCVFVFLGNLNVSPVVAYLLLAFFIIYVVKTIYKSIKERNIPTSDNNISTLAPVHIKKDFSNYFPLILLIINIIVSVIIFYPLIGKAMGLEGIGVIIYGVIIFFSLPSVVLAFLGKYKTISNIIASFLLISPLVFFSLPLFMSK